MGYLKQGDVKGNTKRSKKTKADNGNDSRPHNHTREEEEAALAKYNGGSGYGDGVRESRCVAEAIDGLASIVSTYVTQARNGDNGHSLYTTPNGYPVKVELDTTAPVMVTLAGYDDVEETGTRLLSAIERIADSLAMLAGLSRPRLEHWYEQDEYEPRCRTSACDGGAPGPAEAKSAS